MVSSLKEFCGCGHAAHACSLAEPHACVPVPVPVLRCPPTTRFPRFVPLPHSLLHTGAAKAYTPRVLLPAVDPAAFSALARAPGEPACRYPAARASTRSALTEACDLALAARMAAGVAPGTPKSPAHVLVPLYISTHDIKSSPTTGQPLATAASIAKPVLASALTWWPG